MVDIISLSNACKLDIELVGAKAFSLSLINMKTPSGFVLTKEFIEKVIENNYQLNDALLEELEDAYEAITLSENEEISAKELFSPDTKNIPIVIRPSLLNRKDSKNIPTFLNILNFENLVKYIKEEIKFLVKFPYSGIIIQRLIKPKKSGFIERINGKTIIKATFGYTKAIKESNYYDTYTIDDGNIISEIGVKRIAYLYNDSLKDIEKINVLNSNDPVLEERDITKLMNIFKRISKYDIPFIEWMYEDDFYIIDVELELNKWVKGKMKEERKEESIFNMIFEEKEEPKEEERKEEFIAVNEILQSEEKSKDKKTNKDRIEQAMDKLIEKYSKINPMLKDVLLLFKQDLIELLNKD